MRQYLKTSTEWPKVGIQRLLYYIQVPHTVYLLLAHPLYYMYSFSWVISPASEFIPCMFTDPLKNIRVGPSLGTDGLGLCEYSITTQDCAYVLSTARETLIPTKLMSPCFSVSPQLTAVEILERYQ